jgi:hypothetical protein
MAATNEDIQGALENFFLLFNGVVVFRECFIVRIKVSFIDSMDRF